LENNFGKFKKLLYICNVEFNTVGSSSGLGRFSFREIDRGSNPLPTTCCCLI
jgi:hypothetical protein